MVEEDRKIYTAGVVIKAMFVIQALMIKNFDCAYDLDIILHSKNEEDSESSN